VNKAGKYKGWYVPEAYCSNKCAGIAQIPALRAKAKGSVDKHGYKLLSRLNSNSANGNKMYQQPAHRAAMEKALGRPLTRYETVHHKYDKSDNKIESLELWSNRHSKGQRVSDKIDFATSLLQEYSVKPCCLLAMGFSTLNSGD